jgi:hypothetical protein
MSPDDGLSAAVALAISSGNFSDLSLLGVTSKTVNRIVTFVSHPRSAPVAN